MGDTFEFTLVNKGTNSHSIDFHGKMLAERWNGVVFNGCVNQYQHRPI